MRNMTIRILLSVVTCSLACGVAAGQDPVQVFILAGQSNMEGKGQVETGAGGAIADLDIDRRNPPADFRRQLRYLRRGDGAAQRHLLDHGVGPRGGYHHERGTVGRGSASADQQ